MLEVKFERISFSINEKKTLNPTLKMVEMALMNAGYMDGLWMLRSPERKRKKIGERFRAIRHDSTGNGIRIRCKPGGNETCYEWTLFPPSGTDVDMLFQDLCTLHPKDLRIIRSSTAAASEVASLAGLYKRVVDSKPELAHVRKEEMHSVEKHEDDEEEASNHEDPLVASNNVTMEDAAVAVRPEMHRIESLDISNMGLGGVEGDFTVSRVLVAFGVALGGERYIRRSDSSEIMRRLLNIDGLTATSPVYSSFKGAMKSIMTVLCNKGYIRRIVANNVTSGYEITKKGSSQIEALKQMLSPELSKFLEAWGKPGPAETVSKVSEARQEPIAKIGGIEALKEMIDRYESLESKIKELKTLISEFSSEGENGRLLVSGLSKTIEDKKMEREFLDGEIARLESKMAELRAVEDKNESDLGEFRSELEKLVEERSEIESQICSRTGMVKR